jgi:polyphosphate kinase 2 (PPK2 family)
MFESAELGHKIDKETYKREVPILREALLDAQLELLQSSRFPVIILISGVDGAGKGETVNLLNEWLDPRHIQTHALDFPSDEELERPVMWRYWRILPPKGKIGILFRSWYSTPINDHVRGNSKNSELDQQMERINRFEKMLSDEGALILKFWLHLSKEKQKIRLKTLEKDPKRHWRVTPRDWNNFKIYDRFHSVAESVLRRTSTSEAPWTIIEGSEPRYRYLAVGKAILQALRARLEAGDTHQPPRAAPPIMPHIDTLSVLKKLDLSQHLSKSRYQNDLEDFRDGIIRGERRRGKRWQHPPHNRGPGRQDVSHHTHCRSHRGGTGTALPVAFLEASPAPRETGHFRSFLVRPGAGGAHRGILLPGGLDARL